MKRNSIVRDMNINSLQEGSILEIGDTVFTNAINRTISIKREEELLFGNEKTFETLPIFYIPLPIPDYKLRPPAIRRYNKIPTINVNHIHIKGISNSAVVQVGSANHVNMDARVFHSRQLKGPAERISQE